MKHGDTGLLHKVPQKQTATVPVAVLQSALTRTRHSTAGAWQTHVFASRNFLNLSVVASFERGQEAQTSSSCPTS